MIKTTSQKHVPAWDGQVTNRSFHAYDTHFRLTSTRSLFRVYTDTMGVPGLNRFSSVGDNILWVCEAWAAAKK